MLYKETVSKEMWELLQRFMKDEKLKDFILVGGTALSLTIGHRQSIDIDLFTLKNFKEQDMVAYIKNNYPLRQIREIVESTLLLDIEKVKVDIIAHQYPWQEPIQTEEGVRLASLTDIGAMKLHAIFLNGSRIKDFVDMYFLLEHHPLKTYLEAYKKKYNGNISLAAYGLVHHTNIDMQEKVMLIKGKETSWKKMAERLNKAVFNPTLKFAETKNQITPPKRGFRR